MVWLIQMLRFTDDMLTKMNDSCNECKMKTNKNNTDEILTRSKTTLLPNKL